MVPWESRNCSGQGKLMFYVLGGGRMGREKGMERVKQAFHRIRFGVVD